MTLRALTLENMEEVRQWRNDLPETLRTPYLLTKEMQEQYYRDVICDRRGTTRYWAFWDCFVDDDDTFIENFVGYGGIENIVWEYGLGEVSILIGPGHRRKKHGTVALSMVLEQAFNTLGLKVVTAECYECNPAIEFWQAMARAYAAKVERLSWRKYWQGEYYGSIFVHFHTWGKI